MKYLTKIIIIGLMIVPFVGYAQFTGYQDETTGNTTIWNGSSSFDGSSNTNITNSSAVSGTEGQYTVSGAVNSNASTNSVCNLASKTINGYVDYIGCGIRVAVLPFIFTLALVSFIWGVTTMMRNPASEEAQSKGRTFILWGIIGFFAITAVYALVAIIRRTIGFGSNFKDDTTPYVQLKEKVQNLK